MTVFSGNFAAHGEGLAGPGGPDDNGTAPAEGHQDRAISKDLSYYLRHVEGGETIRSLAREAGCHASTILRRIRRIEQRRDDPVIDTAIEEAARGRADEPQSRREHEQFRRILRRLCESGAVLVVSETMEKAIVVRDEIRLAIVDRRIAQKMAMNGWLKLKSRGRMNHYVIAVQGRDWLRASGRKGAARVLPAGDDLAGAAPVAPGFAESQTEFGHAGQHRVWEDRDLFDPEDGTRRRYRVNVADNPLRMLGKRRGADGGAYLTQGEMAAGERLRDDFELAQTGPRITQNWDRFLTAGVDAGATVGGFLGGSEGARNRVAAALRELGPGMGDLCLRVCCYLEGIEMTERRLGWAARSGKVVLKLALMRLEAHYLRRYGPGLPLIG